MTNDSTDVTVIMFNLSINFLFRPELGTKDHEGIAWARNAIARAVCGSSILQSLACENDYEEYIKERRQKTYNPWEQRNGDMLGFITDGRGTLKEISRYSGIRVTPMSHQTLDIITLLSCDHQNRL